MNQPANYANTRKFAGITGTAVSANPAKPPKGVFANLQVQNGRFAKTNFLQMLTELAVLEEENRRASGY
jgi:hypothetical protein